MDVNELKHAIKHCTENNCIGCMYRDDLQCVNHIMSAADRCIAELEERIAVMQESMEALEKRNEPIEPIVVPIGEDVSVPFIRYKCPKCGMFQIEFKPNYCSYCGQAVKWDG